MSFPVCWPWLFFVFASQMWRFPQQLQQSVDLGRLLPAVSITGPRSHSTFIYKDRRWFTSPTPRTPWTLTELARFRPAPTLQTVQLLVSFEALSWIMYVLYVSSMKHQFSVGESGRLWPLFFSIYIFFVFFLINIIWYSWTFLAGFTDLFLAISLDFFCCFCSTICIPRCCDTGMQHYRKRYRINQPSKRPTPYGGQRESRSFSCYRMLYAGFSSRSPQVHLVSWFDWGVRRSWTRHSDFRKTGAVRSTTYVSFCPSPDSRDFIYFAFAI